MPEPRARVISVAPSDQMPDGERIIVWAWVTPGDETPRTNSAYLSEIREVLRKADEAIASEEKIKRMGAEVFELVKAGYDAIVVTGTPMKLRDGRRVDLPSYRVLEEVAPKGVEFNDTYAWAVGVLVKTGSLPENVRCAVYPADPKAP